MVIVGGVYIYWDVLATERGDWAFNDSYILGIRFFGLPLEEILFFVTVPYAMIFLYETFSFFSERLEFITYRWKASLFYVVKLIEQLIILHTDVVNVF